MSLDNKTNIDWTKFGGIVGRGVLLDYVAYTERHNIVYDPTDRFTISLDDLKAIIKEEKVELKVGDILLVRSGYVKWHDNATHEERVEGAKKPQFGGVESTPEVVEWLWNQHFSAVAGDSPSWEAMPPKGEFYLVCLIEDWTDLARLSLGDVGNAAW
jgi:kynurenine formamidase